MSSWNCSRLTKTVGMAFFSLIMLTSIGFAKETTVTFHNRLIDGAKVWVPEPVNIKIKKGSVVKVELINHLDDAHGFHLPQFTDPLVVPGKLSNQDSPKILFSFEANQKPGTYEFRCHMHPAHVGGSLQITD